MEQLQACRSRCRRNWSSCSPSCAPSCCARWRTLRELVAACADGALDAAGQEQARSLAHQLAGSLGSFGFAAAGAAARALELRFKQGVAPGSGPLPARRSRADLEARVSSGPPAPAGARARAGHPSS